MAFFKRRKGGGDEEPPDDTSKPVSDPNLPITEEEERQWQEMGVPYKEAKIVGVERGRKLTPMELVNITNEMNVVLQRNGFEFKVTYHQTVGMMVDQIVYSRNHTEKLELPEIAVWRYADYLLRKQLGLDAKAGFDEEKKTHLEGIFQSLRKRAETRKAEIRLSKIAETGSQPEVGHRPIIADSVEALILQEAEFHARRELELGKDGLIPEGELERFKEDAWVKYRKMKGLDSGGKATK